MADLTQDVNAEIKEGKESLFAAAPTFVFDATTWFTKRLPAIRDAAEEAVPTNLKDTNQALDVVLPDA